MSYTPVTDASTLNGQAASYYLSGIVGFTAKTANYTMTASDTAISVDTTSGAVTITLPASGVATGKTFHIKKIAGSASVTLSPASGTIDGSSTFAFSTTNQNVLVLFNGTNYLII